MPLRTACEAVLPAPPFAVYDVVADIGRRPQWLRELQLVDTPTKTAVVGVRFEGVSTLLGHTFHGVAHVVRAQRGEILAERVHIGGCFTSEWTFEATADGGTRVCHTMEVELPGGPLRWLERLVLRRRVRELQRSGLAALAAQLVG